MFLEDDVLLVFQKLFKNYSQPSRIRFAATVVYCALEESKDVPVNTLPSEFATPEFLIGLQTWNDDILPRVELLAQRSVSLWRQEYALLDVPLPVFENVGTACTRKGPDVVSPLGTIPVGMVVDKNVECSPVPLVCVRHCLPTTPLVLPKQVALAIDRHVKEVGFLWILRSDWAMKEVFVNSNFCPILIAYATTLISL